MHLDQTLIDKGMLYFGKEGAHLDSKKFVSRWIFTAKRSAVPVLNLTHE